jgi:dynein heavy chain
MFKNIHKSVEQNSVAFKQQLRRYNYVTPTSYLELLTMYKQILSAKRKEVGYQTNRLKSGLDKLESANKEV